MSEIPTYPNEALGDPERVRNMRFFPDGPTVGESIDALHNDVHYWKGRYDEVAAELARLRDEKIALMRRADEWRERFESLSEAKNHPISCPVLVVQPEQVTAEKSRNSALRVSNGSECAIRRERRRCSIATRRKGWETMRTIQLETIDGGFVARVEIVPFPDKGMPDIVSWGDRVFQCPNRQGRNARDEWVYREAFAVVSFTPSPGVPDEPPAPVDRSRRCTVGEAVAPGEANTEDRGDGQQKGYVVLCDDERSKGFVRPVRRSYKHVGIRPKYPLRDLTDKERELYKDIGYAKFEAYPDGSPERGPGNITGRFWTEKQLNSGCGTVTTMGEKIAETYARDPAFYSGTFCCGCGTHLPVGERGEFVWLDDGTRVGT